MNFTRFMRNKTICTDYNDSTPIGKDDKDFIIEFDDGLGEKRSKHVIAPSEYIAAMILKGFYKENYGSEITVERVYKEVKKEKWEK